MAIFPDKIAVGNVTLVGHDIVVKDAEKNNM